MSVIVKSFMFTLKGALAYHLDDVEQLVGGTDNPRLYHFQLGCQRFLQVLDNSFVFFAGTDAFGVSFKLDRVGVRHTARDWLVNFGHGLTELDLVGEHAIDGLKVLLGFIVEFFGLGFEFLEASFGVDIDGIFGMLADVELLLELLRSLGGGGGVSISASSY
ncbi:hypothetical protein HG531_007991 [Fusarium graminearum]|nr:hypothetical protein HG531_007991 [Fusarium graminearum]